MSASPTTSPATARSTPTSSTTDRRPRRSTAHPAFPVGGASHSLELRYLFDVGDAPTLSPAQQTLSEQMIDYWSEFVRTGAPGADGLPAWPEVGDDPAKGKRLSLKPDDITVMDDFDRIHQCPFWATLK